MKKNVGLALIPAGIYGRAGSTLSHPLVYMVTSEEVSGKNNQDIALNLLAKITTAKLNDRHALESAHLGILKTQTYQLPSPSHPNYKNLKMRKRFLQEISSILAYNYYMPNHAFYSLYFEIIWENMVAVENGRISPETAAKNPITELRGEITDFLIVE